ncbi:creatininase family protein [Sulfitobacter aestuariivivens]|uniref:Creatininase family protein n=1 Tax=Sulfitobacter aestuariivivens TaxID=2766981 RepID=A0A927D6L0_9RHOB|nr:creatininase family protein [Sulfitobacter aestuariivivens]MBD3665346.1 creatininase family protein [Sulfitobacter aestuariivivens]
MSVRGYWADLPSSDFAKLPLDTVAVLPLGAIEQHGPHLPLSVDRDLADAVVAKSLDALSDQQNVLFMPTLAVTKSGEHDQFPGTLSLSAETLLAVLRDIGASVARTGISRLVLLNAHGGNAPVLDIAARDLRMKYEMIVATCSWFGFAEDDGAVDPQSLADDIHAGELETSAMLAAHPQKVDMSQAQDFTPAMAAWRAQYRFIGLNGQAAKPAWVAGDLNAHGACGNASVANAEKGAHLLSSAAQNFAAFLDEFARFDLRHSDS